MDNYCLKLSGKAELEEPLAIGHNFHVALSGSITEENISDNEDGSKTHSFKFKPVIVEVITEQGERLRAKDTRSRGQQLRSLLWKQWRAANEPIEFEDYYDREMVKIMEQITFS